MAGVFAATALLWITRASLDFGFVRMPGWGELFGEVNGRSRVSDATVAVAMAIVCFVVPAGEGRRLMDWETARRMPWEILLLIGGGFCIAGAFKASGLDQRVGEALGPHLAHLPEWAIVVLVITCMAALTEVTSNTATTAVLLPVLGEAAVAAGISPLFTMLPATIAASVAFMLPVATPPNAVVFSSRLVPAAVIAEVERVTHIAPPDAQNRLIGEPLEQHGVINYAVVKLGLCAGITRARYVTTTEVYPDSPRVDDQNCNDAQVAAIVGSLDYALAHAA